MRNIQHKRKLIIEQLLSISQHLLITGTQVLAAGETVLVTVTGVITA